MTRSGTIAPGSSLTGRGDPVIVTIFDHPTSVARALGLDIELPDPDNEDPDYWDRVHADGGYKGRLEGRIADPWLEGDPDWALLLRLPCGEVWFDIEEGFKLFLAAAEIPRALLLLDGLRGKGIRLSGEDGGSLVTVTPTRLGGSELARVRERLEAAGLVQGFKRSSGSCRTTGAGRATDTREIRTIAAGVRLRSRRTQRFPPPRCPRPLAAHLACIPLAAGSANAWMGSLS